MQVQASSVGEKNPLPSLKKLSVEAQGLRYRGWGCLVLQGSFPEGRIKRGSYLDDAASKF